ncbi:hypothetical protein Trydic_g7023 [Trypoxylus dichotomus]
MNKELPPYSPFPRNGVLLYSSNSPIFNINLSGDSFKIATGHYQKRRKHLPDRDDGEPSEMRSRLLSPGHDGDVDVVHGVDDDGRIERIGKGDYTRERNESLLPGTVGSRSKANINRKL